MNKPWIKNLFAVASSLFVLSGHSAEFSSAGFSFYCSTPDIKYKQQVSAGETIVVKPHHGPYLQISGFDENAGASAGFIQAGVGAGVEAECMEYLLSVSSSANSADSSLLARVTFDFDKSSLDSESRYILEQLKDKLRSNSKDLLVEGHTDSSGSEDYNFDLGLKRTETVMNYLSEDVATQQGKSYGELKPVTDETSAEKRKANRRVDISSVN
ncbi:OmpA family protein [Vibrio sp. JC009]|uniref:OmpA family protein n=1 Tax=Vibrio sp. JC009 TaxID=2912314 RepID=UPI0023B022A8|nr:OmpA family protein [Vibrio sp. JC009]WED22307.1 OmpA family protein [Vibrio sp. JC009]